MVVAWTPLSGMAVAVVTTSPCLSDNSTVTDGMVWSPTSHSWMLPMLATGSFGDFAAVGVFAGLGLHTFEKFPTVLHLLHSLYLAGHVSPLVFARFLAYQIDQCSRLTM